VDALVVVVIDVLAKEPSEMTFVEDDDVIEQLPTNGANGALSRTVLPRAPVCRPLRFDSEAIDRMGDGKREN